MQVFKRFTDF